MSSPLATFNKLVPAGAPADWDAAEVVSLKSPVAQLPEGLTHSRVAVALGDFKYVTETRDHKWVDFLLIGALTIFIHNTVVDHFSGAAFEQEIVEPIKPETKVQITLTRPQPKPVPPPPPKVKPQPPKPKVVPLKPPKIQPVPKVVEEAPAPAPVEGPVVDNAPPAPPAPPAPVVEEKITEPVADAAYLHNPLPEYPEVAQERGWEGKVVMKVHVLPDGTTDSVTVSKSSGQKVLDDAAVKAVLKWSFVPAKRGDTPIARYTTVPFTFKL
ncbi:energy transducer TonB [Methylomonas fluvii]|uniref:Protein TonB n=1 Tax=Methylomonas fluvii TaxID=1854564 RepID=A0ABR9DLW4_9GAMM|nr:energy transducer TonB [Methylomonas fluvii]MBD9363338.1 energy transducer TonB [Methylomonas fluvii]CAD6876607.1 putative TonB-dependent receptor [Methylomonas fluvii]